MTNAKKIILFDIDYTLFDTDVARDHFYPPLAKALGFSMEEFTLLAKDAHHEIQKKLDHFDSKTYLIKLQNMSRLPVTLAQLEEIFWHESVFTNALDKDAAKVLQELQDRGFTLGIFSSGEHAHQRRKIESLKQFFTEEHVFIFPNKITNLSQVFTTNARLLVLVDDLPLVLSTVKQYNPKIITVLKQTKKRYEQHDQITTFKPDYAITTLKELVTIL